MMLATLFYWHHRSYTTAQEDMSPAGVADILARVQAGELTAGGAAGGKGAKSGASTPRKSIDE
jgi:hypothetical protein